MRNLHKAFDVFKKGAGRDIGLFIFMLVFGVVAAAILLPVIWLMSVLPDWTWWIGGIGFSIWMIFGDTIAKAWAAYRGDRP